MSDIQIYPQTIEQVKERLCTGGRVIDHYDTTRMPNWFNRYLKVSSLTPAIPISAVQYKLRHLSRARYEDPCYIVLEILSANSDSISLSKFLREHTKSQEEEGVLFWENIKICRLNKPLSGHWEVADYFEELCNIFDPLLDEYAKELDRIKALIAFNEGTPFSGLKVSAFECNIVKVKDLDFSSFKIPFYQRSYKWQPVNVNQLINDIREYAKESSYRLGSLVLHQGDIVDGQQRIVTLSLLLHQLMRNPEIRSHTQYNSLFEQVTGFWGRTEYNSYDALNNIVSNATAIRHRQNDLDWEFFLSLVENCEFVVIRLPELHEAFQFFDSQNARGKDLEAHDLLKAYHLREMDNLDAADQENIRLWQKIATPKLVSLFLCLYRIRMWSKGESARFFTKSDIGEFKGLSIGKDKSPMPLYMQAVLLNKLFNLLTEFAKGQDETLLRKDYPFQLSGVIINGARFFDMILHYEELYSHVTDANWCQYDADARDILILLNDYDGMYRTGDEYVRNVFDALMLFYIDKFGAREIGKAAKLFFLYAYSIRVSQFRVSLSSIDNTVVNGPLFKIIRDATHPYDVLNFQVAPVNYSDLAENRSESLYQRFEDMNMISHE